MLVAFAGKAPVIATLVTAPGVGSVAPKLAGGITTEVVPPGLFCEAGLIAVAVGACSIPKFTLLISALTTSKLVEIPGVATVEPPAVVPI
jgi:hypothetical protein